MARVDYIYVSNKRDVGPEDRTGRERVNNGYDGSVQVGVLWGWGGALWVRRLI